MSTEKQRRTTHGDIARYLEAESPETPIADWPTRFKQWKKSGKPKDLEG